MGVIFIQLTVGAQGDNFFSRFMSQQTQDRPQFRGIVEFGGSFAPRPEISHARADDVLILQRMLGGV